MTMGNSILHQPSKTNFTTFTFTMQVKKLGLVNQNTQSRLSQRVYLVKLWRPPRRKWVFGALFDDMENLS
jgi:hypothetical protein